jgi:Leucine-rich repeat (LRR) protein
VNGNKLKSLPRSLVQLNKLRELYLGFNEFPTLPESLGKLSNLEILYLVSNKFKSLPESLCQLSNLIELHLHDNELTTLPNIENLHNLKYTYLEINKIKVKEIKNKQYNEKDDFFSITGTLSPLKRQKHVNPTNGYSIISIYDFNDDSGKILLHICG